MVKICHNWNPLKVRVTSRRYFRIIFIISRFQGFKISSILSEFEKVTGWIVKKIKQKFCHLYFSSWKLSKIHYWTNKTVHRIKDKHPWFSSEKMEFFEIFIWAVVSLIIYQSHRQRKKITWFSEKVREILISLIEYLIFFKTKTCLETSLD